MLDEHLQIPRIKHTVVLPQRKNLLGLRGKIVAKFANLQSGALGNLRIGCVRNTYLYVWPSSVLIMFESEPEANVG